METILSRITKSYNAKTQRHQSRKRSLPLYQRLHNLLKDNIINSEIPPNSKLPPSRALAETLSVSRSTVIKAYDLLKLEGFIESTVGSKYTVKGLQAESDAPISKEIAPFIYPDTSEVGKSFSANISLINSTDDKSIAFRPGLPPLDIFPVNQWKNLSNLYWRYIKSSALSYSSSSGIHQLKLNIANYLNLNRGIKCNPQQIIVVSGSLQSLYLVGSALLNPGDTVTIENPTFPNVHSIFKGLRAEVNSVEIDENGLKVIDLNETHAKSKLIHTTPSCHYPTNVKMSKQRKLDLLKWASRNETFIIENDYEHEIHNKVDSEPTLFSLDKEQRTIYMSTFNRLLHPSIRIGFMVLPNYLLHTVEAILKHSHRFVPPSIQVVLNQFIEKNYLHMHIKNVREAAEERHEIFTNTFNKYFSNFLHIKPSPILSLQVLAEIKGAYHDKEIVDLLAQHNIIAHRYSKCFVSDQKKQGLILGYSSVRPPVIKQKVRHMAGVLEGLKN